MDIEVGRTSEPSLVRRAVSSAYIPLGTGPLNPARGTSVKVWQPLAFSPEFYSRCRGNRRGVEPALIDHPTGVRLLSWSATTPNRRFHECIHIVAVAWKTSFADINFLYCRDWNRPSWTVIECPACSRFNPEKKLLPSSFGALHQKVGDALPIDLPRHEGERENPLGRRRKCK